MQLKNKKTWLSSIVVLLILVAPLFPSTALADHGRTREECYRLADEQDKNECIQHAEESGTQTATRPASNGDFEGDCNTNDLSQDNCGIIAYLVLFINVLSAIAGIVIVSMIVFGGIRYSAARDNPQAVQSAKSHITNAILALLLYLFFYSFLNFIIPGGVF